jgi:hypothetical protein
MLKTNSKNEFVRAVIMILCNNNLFKSFSNVSQNRNSTKACKRYFCKNLSALRPTVEQQIKYSTCR